MTIPLTPTSTDRTNSVYSTESHGNTGRKVKDHIPLALYETISGGHTSGSEPVDASAVYAPSVYSKSIPQRRPVPSSCSTRPSKVASERIDQHDIRYYDLPPFKITGSASEPALQAFVRPVIRSASANDIGRKADIFGKILADKGPGIKGQNTSDEDAEELATSFAKYSAAEYDPGNPYLSGINGGDTSTSSFRTRDHVTHHSPHQNYNNEYSPCGEIPLRIDTSSDSFGGRKTSITSHTLSSVGSTGPFTPSTNSCRQQSSSFSPLRSVHTPASSIDSSFVSPYRSSSRAVPGTPMYVERGSYQRPSVTSQGKTPSYGSNRQQTSRQEASSTSSKNGYQSQYVQASPEQESLRTRTQSSASVSSLSRYDPISFLSRGSTTSIRNLASRKNSSASTPLPLPDFIAPPIATRQRYVSVGGTERLCERTALEGFQLSGEVETGVSMHMDEMTQALDSIWGQASGTEDRSDSSQGNAGGSGGGEKKVIRSLKRMFSNKGNDNGNGD